MEAESDRSTGAPVAASSSRLADWGGRALSLEGALILLQLALLFVSRVWQERVFADDAYIHFRNALNWAEGRGFVFNPTDPPIIGTTSPVYAFLLGVIHKVTRADLHSIAIGLNFLADCGVMLVGLAWMRRAGVSLFFRHAVTLILSAEHSRMYYANAGMEMSFFLLASVAIVELFLRGRWAWSGALLGLLGWIRPEGVVVAVALAAGALAARRRVDLLRLVAVASAVALAMMAALWFNYGAVVPQSIVAKAAAPWYQKWAGYAHVEFLMRIAELGPFYPFHGAGASWGSIGDRINTTAMILPTLIMMGVGAHAFWRTGQRELAVFLPAFIVGFYAFFASFNPQVFFWYHIPYYFAILLLSGVGWWAMIETVLNHARARRLLGELHGRGRRRRLWLMRVAATIFLVLMTITGASRTNSSRLWVGETPLPAMMFRFLPFTSGNREVQYRVIAETMNDWLAPDRDYQVGVVEVGIFGFYFEGKILDTFGLVSPEALDVIKPEIAETIDPSCREHPLNVYVALQPDFIVTDDGWLPGTPPAFTSIYEELKIPGITIRVFVRRDLLPELAPEFTRIIARGPEGRSALRADAGSQTRPTTRPEPPRC